MLERARQVVPMLASVLHAASCLGGTRPYKTCTHTRTDNSSSQKRLNFDLRRGPAARLRLSSTALLAQPSGSSARSTANTCGAGAARCSPSPPRTPCSPRDRRDAWARPRRRSSRRPIMKRLDALCGPSTARSSSPRSRGGISTRVMLEERRAAVSSVRLRDKAADSDKREKELKSRPDEARRRR